MSKPRFSVAVIARNEEETLPRLINSLKDFQDRGGDIWVLDTGSTDKTIEVAEKMGCKVEAVGDKFKVEIDEELANKINEKFIVDGEAPVVKAGDSLFDFSSARNHIASFPKTDMIAMPDCDEIYTKLDIDKVDKAIEDGAEQFEYNFVFSHDEYGNPLIKFLHSKFYNRNKLHWDGIIHEVLKGGANKVFFGEDIIKLEHYQNEKTNRSGYLKGLALDCFQHPDKDRQSHYFAREMYYCGRYKSAIKEFERHLTLGGWVTERSQSMLFIGDCYKKLKNTDEMIKWYNKSFDLSARREPLMRLAEYYLTKQSFQQAVAYAEAALTIKQPPFYSNYQPYYKNVPHEVLYLSYWRINDWVSSEKHWRKALEYCPTNKKYISDGQFYNKKELKNHPKVSFIIPTLGRESGLKRCVDSIKALNYPQDKIEIIVKQDYFGEDRIGVPELVKQGVEESTGDWVVFASNDTEFTSDSLKEALLVGDNGYVAFNTGEVSADNGNINEHFMIRKDIIEKIGEVFDTDFYHVGVDNLLYEKILVLGIFKRAEKAIVKHHHFTKGAEMDEVYKLGWDEERVKADRELLVKKLEEVTLGKLKK